MNIPFRPLLAFFLTSLFTFMPRQHTHGQSDTDWLLNREALLSTVPTMAGAPKDIIFTVTNNQYQQLVTRLAAIRTGIETFTLPSFAQEPAMEQYSKRTRLSDKQTTTTVYTQPEASQWNISVSASGIFSKICSANYLPKVKAETGYFGAGVNYRFSEYLYAGAYAGYEGMRAWNHYGSKLYSNGLKYGLYGTAQCRGFAQWSQRESCLQSGYFSQSHSPNGRCRHWDDNFYVNAIIGGGNAFFTLNRSEIGAENWRASSHPLGGEVDSLLGIGYEFSLYQWKFGVNNSIQYTYFGMAPFNESGAKSLNTHVNRQNFNSLVYTLGGNVSYLWNISPNYNLFPTIGLYWQHEFLNGQQTVNGNYINGSNTSFNFTIPNSVRNYAFGIVGLAAQIGRFGAYGYYAPQFLGRVTTHGILLGLNYTF